MKTTTIAVLALMALCAVAVPAAATDDLVQTQDFVGYTCSIIEVKTTSKTVNTYVATVTVKGQTVCI